MSNFLKGICYEPFPSGYTPSEANNTCIWYGSDIAAYNIKPLWGESFSPIDGPDKGKLFNGRNDLKILSELGVNLIRLYDWDSRNNHIPFLDYCHSLGIQVLVPISNYNLGAFGEPPNINESIVGLINSFSNSGDRNGTDYHPAIYGIIIGSESDQQAQIPKGYVVKYTQKIVEIEKQLYPFFREVKIGHPISFAINGPGWSGTYPCFGYLDKILPSLINEPKRNLKERLIICPHTYNDASYLYKNAQGSREGWVELCWNRYKLPILFCEMGYSRLMEDNYLDIIKNQIEASISYAQTQNNLGKLLGVCYFQYCDKVWMPDTTEGSFGAVYNTASIKDVVNYGPHDFTHSVGIPCTHDFLNIQELQAHPVLETLRNLYG